MSISEQKRPNTEEEKYLRQVPNPYVQQGTCTKSRARLCMSTLLSQPTSEGVGRITDGMGGCIPTKTDPPGLSPVEQEGIIPAEDVGIAPEVVFHAFPSSVAPISSHGHIGFGPTGR